MAQQSTGSGNDMAGTMTLSPSIYQPRQTALEDGTRLEWAEAGQSHYFSIVCKSRNTQVVQQLSERVSAAYEQAREVLR